MTPFGAVSFPNTTKVDDFQVENVQGYAKMTQTNASLDLWEGSYKTRS